MNVVTAIESTQWLNGDIYDCKPAMVKHSHLTPLKISHDNGKSNNTALAREQSNVNRPYPFSSSHHVP